MGGAQAGEVASSLAAGVLDERPPDGGGEERLAELIQEANRRVWERAREDATLSGMGTTMTVALVASGGESVTIGHVGDSRAYRIREGRLEQLTDDHSLVADLVRSGKLSPEEAEIHPQRSVITRAIGTDPDVDVDTFTVATEPGDVYMICSDGLTDMVGADAIQKAAERHRGDLERAAKELVDLANKAGGEDNITVVFFEIVGEGEGAAAVTSTEETAKLPALDAAPDPDEEDTLDGVPAPQVATAPSPVDTMVLSTDEIAAMSTAQHALEQPRAPRVLLWVLILAALVVAAALGWWLLDTFEVL
jgi:protein phosphatase